MHIQYSSLSSRAPGHDNRWPLSRSWQSDQANHTSAHNTIECDACKIVKAMRNNMYHRLACPFVLNWIEYSVFMPYHLDIQTADCADRYFQSLNGIAPQRRHSLSD